MESGRFLHSSLYPLKKISLRRSSAGRFFMELFEVCFRISVDFGSKSLILVQNTQNILSQLIRLL